MTDEQIAEIYSLARESFFGGQKSFQIQAYPFRMTPANMAKHRNSPHMAFWRMIKQGYDAFEVTRLEPKVDVCEKHYVFNAETSAKFSAADKCPAYRVPEDIMSAVREKQRRDDIQTAELTNRGVPAAPAAMNVDGGMNPTFLAAVKSHGGPGATIHTAVGTIPPHVNPPAETAEATTGSFLSLASAESKPAPGPRSSVQVASAAPSSSGGITGFFGNLFGSKAEDQSADTRSPPTAGSTPKSKPAAAASPAAAKPTQTAAVGAIRPKSEPRPADTKPADTKTANNATATKPQSAAPRQEANADATAGTGLLNGAAPTMPSNGFEGRFGPWQ